ncbi:glycosyltransferase family 2 protein [Leptospira sp. WS92.C1]
MLKISVIIPTYNRSAILSQCLDSLLLQNYPKENYEILVVDNASKDGTFEVVNDYQRKYGKDLIRYVYEVKPGLVHARHCGYKNSQYDILSYTDDDAILHPNWLASIAKSFESSDSPSAVGGKILIRWNETPPDWIFPYESLLGKLDYGNEDFVKEGLFINGGNFHIRKEILKILGGFNPDQIGDWLIGDGETGLCRKLHKNGYMIGWAPNALMEHYQVVSKNATKEDIKRRYINNGRCEVYDLVVAKNSKFSVILKYFMKTSIRLLESFLGILKYFFRAEYSEPKLGYYFIFHFYLTQYLYFLNLKLNSRFRKLVYETSWLEES